MSWIREPDESEPSGAVAAAFERDRASRGYVTNYTKVLAHRPPVLDAWAGLNRAVKGGMDTRTYELATLGAALRLRSSYCALAHGSALLDGHLSADALRAAATGGPSAELDPADRAVLRLAGRVAAGAADMTEDDLAELRDLGWDDVAILDVVLAAAARCFFSTVLDAVGARPDAAYRTLDPALLEALSVGRPAEGSDED